MPPQKCPWVPLTDPKTGRTYYGNRLTKKTVWKMPPEYKEYLRQKRALKREPEEREQAGAPETPKPAESVQKQPQEKEQEQEKQEASDFSSSNDENEASDFSTDSSDGPSSDDDSSDDDEKRDEPEPEKSEPDPENPEPEPEQSEPESKPVEKETATRKSMPPQTRPTRPSLGFRGPKPRRGGRPAGRAPSGAAPSGTSRWRKLTDPRSGRDYYVDKVTRKRQWKKPQELIDAEEAEAAATVESRPRGESEVSNASSEKSSQAEVTPVQSQPPQRSVAPAVRRRTSLSTTSTVSVASSAAPSTNENVAAATATPAESASDAASVSSRRSISKSKSVSVRARSVDTRAKAALLQALCRQNRFVQLAEKHPLKYQLVQYGDMYFRKARSGIFGSKSTSDMLIFTPKKISGPLKRLPDAEHARAVQSFKNITGYMGDRKSSKKPLGHAQKFLQQGLEAGEDLRDEMYVQLCKQTNGNPSQEATLAGWRLMALALQCFPPSTVFSTYLACYIWKQRDEEDTGIADYARFCIQALADCMDEGSSKSERHVSAAQIESIDSQVEQYNEELRARESAIRRELAERDARVAGTEAAKDTPGDTSGTDKDAVSGDKKSAPDTVQQGSETESKSAPAPPVAPPAVTATDESSVVAVHPLVLKNELKRHSKWRMKRDKVRNRNYYFEVDKREPQWQEPAEFKAAQQHVLAEYRRLQCDDSKPVQQSAARVSALGAGRAYTLDNQAVLVLPDAMVDSGILQRLADAGFRLDMFSIPQQQQ